MSQDYAIRIKDLPCEARQRAEAFLEEGVYYGWHLQGVAAHPVGDLLQCTMEFDSTRIIFLAPAGIRSGSGYAQLRTSAAK